MDDIISQIINPENLYWAWEKAKKAYSQVDTLYDEIEVAAFETNLAEELQKIQKDISNESYKVSPIKPVAHPKSAKKNKPRTRQTFWISVRDQVTWIAVVNIIGPYLDRAMPFWSFGNRLYISVFPKKEESKGEIKWGFGPYRHTTKHIYRKWKQSWPFYRRCVSIVTKKMTHIRAKDGSNTDNASWYDEKEFEVMENNESLPEHLKVKYLENEYWEEQELSGEIYWASIDLKEFYPNINTDVIINNFKEYFPKDKQTPELENLFKTLLMFPIDKSGWTKSQLEKIGIRDEEICKGIPTGLFVAGFLANLALLHIDKKIDKFLSNNKKVAHFRFVDDHVFLADSYDNLKCWIEQYENLLNESGIGVKINEDKIEPEALREFYKRKKTKRAQKLDKLACYGTKLDPNYPAPLMTQTLTKISNIVKIDFDLLEESERDQIISDIEHLLITDFPDEELRRDTRISFAATMLSRLVPKIQIDITELYEIDKQKSYKRDEYKSSKEDISKYKEDSKRYKEIKNQIDQLKSNIKELNDNFKKNKKNFDKKEFISLKHTSKLMLKALRDNYEKPKLWVRAIEFCRKTGINEIDSIWELLKNC